MRVQTFRNSKCQRYMTVIIDQQILGRVWGHDIYFDFKQTVQLKKKKERNINLFGDQSKQIGRKKNAEKVISKISYFNCMDSCFIKKWLHIVRWISHRYTYIPSLKLSPPNSLLVWLEPWVEFPLSHTANSHSCIYFIYVRIYVTIVLSPFTPPSPPSCPMSTSLFSMSAAP